MLKDLVRRERIYQLVSPGLREQFPPLRSMVSSRETPNLPTRTVTFFVTDIVGSRAFDAFARAVRATASCSSVTSTSCARWWRHDGRLFEFVGDSFIGAFSGTSDAVLAAVAAMALGASDWPEGGRPTVSSGSTPVRPSVGAPVTSASASSARSVSTRRVGDRSSSRRRRKALSRGSTCTERIAERSRNAARGLRPPGRALQAAGRS